MLSRAKARPIRKNASRYAHHRLMTAATATTPNDWAHAPTTVPTLRTFGIRRKCSLIGGTGRPASESLAVGRTSGRRSTGGTMVATIDVMLHPTCARG